MTPKTFLPLAPARFSHPHHRSRRSSASSERMHLCLYLRSSFRHRRVRMTSKTNIQHVPFALRDNPALSSTSALMSHLPVLHLRHAVQGWTVTRPRIQMHPLALALPLPQMLQVQTVPH